MLVLGPSGLSSREVPGTFWIRFLEDLVAWDVRAHPHGHIILQLLSNWMQKANGWGSDRM